MNFEKKYIKKNAKTQLHIATSIKDFKIIKIFFSISQSTLKTLTFLYQIYTLMKFDSYLRFLRSDIFAECAIAEQSGRPLPYEERENALNKNDPNKGSKSKLRSFIPWSRIKSSLVNSKAASLSSMPKDGRRAMMYKLTSSITKLRSKSLDEQIQNSVRSSSATLMMGKYRNMMHQGHSSSVDHGAREGGGSIDFDAITSSETPGPSRIASLSSSTSAEMSPVGGHHSSAASARKGIPSSLLRVTYPDGSSTIVSCSSGETLDSLIRRLLLKRRIDYTRFAVVKTGESVVSEQ